MPTGVYIRRKPSSNKGRIPWNKGIKGVVKHSEESRKKRSSVNSGKNNPFYGKKHSEQTKEKMRENSAHCQYWLGKKMPPVSEDTRKKMSKVKKGKLPANWYSLDKSKGGLNSRKVLALRKPTKLEIVLYNELEKLGIKFEKQAKINDKFLVDAFVLSHNLIIEVDGEYWHNLEKIKRKDKAENAYLKKCGYNLLRIPEVSIKDGSYLTKLQEVLN